MARATRSVDIQIKGDARDLHKAINELPKSAQKEARKALASIERAAAKAAKTIDATTKSSGPGLKQAKDGVDGVKDALDSMGIAGGKSAGGVKKAIDAVMKMGAAGGPAGVAIGVATAAVLAFGAAGLSAAVASSAMIKELDEMGRADAITPEQRAAVGAMDVAIREATVAGKELTVMFGSEFAPAITAAAEGVVAISREMRVLIGYMQQGREATEGFRRVLTAIGTLGASEAFGAFGDSAGASSAQVYELEQRVRDQAKATEELVRQEAEWAQQDAAIQKAREEGDRAAEAAARAAQARAAEAAKRQAEKLKALDEYFAQEAKYAADDQRLAAERAATAKAMDRAMAESAEAHLRRVAEVRAQLDAEAEARAAAGSAALQSQMQAMPAAFGQLAGLIHEQAEATAERQRAELLGETALQKRQLDGQLRRGEIDEAQHATRLRQLRTETRSERAALRDRAENQKKAAKAAFAAYKVGAIAQATANAAVAYLAVLGSPAIASLGPFAPLAAAGVVAPAAATQIAAIATQKAYHVGGVAGDYSRGPDEVPALLRQGEGVLTPRAVQQVGGPAGVDAMNRGEAPGGGMPSRIMITLVLPDGTQAAASGTMDAGGNVYAAMKTSPGRRPVGAR